MSLSSSAVSTDFSLPAICPDCDEWASSAMTANVLPLRPLFFRISFIANGNVWMVTTMISLPSIKALASSPDFDRDSGGRTGLHWRVTGRQPQSTGTSILAASMPDSQC